MVVDADELSPVLYTECAGIVERSPPHAHVVTVAFEKTPQLQMTAATNDRTCHTNESCQNYTVLLLSLQVCIKYTFPLYRNVDIIYSRNTFRGYIRHIVLHYSYFEMCDLASHEAYLGNKKARKG